MCLVARSCPTLCDPMTCSPPGSSLHEILQARILEWGANPSSRGIFPTQGSNPVLLHCSRILYLLSHQRLSVRRGFFKSVTSISRASIQHHPHESLLLPEVGEEAWPGSCALWNDGLGSCPLSGVGTFLSHATTALSLGKVGDAFVVF